MTYGRRKRRRGRGRAGGARRSKTRSSVSVNTPPPPQLVHRGAFLLPSVPLGLPGVCRDTDEGRRIRQRAAATDDDGAGKQGACGSQIILAADDEAAGKLDECGSDHRYTSR